MKPTGRLIPNVLVLALAGALGHAADLKPDLKKDQVGKAPVTFMTGAKLAFDGGL